MKISQLEVGQVYAWADPERPYSVSIQVLGLALI